jgi:hypothetical protein
MLGCAQIASYLDLFEQPEPEFSSNLLRFRHARTVRERDDTAKLHTDLRSSILRVDYSRLRRKRGPTIVYCSLFVSLISESKLAGNQAIGDDKLPGFFDVCTINSAGSDLSDYLIGSRQHVGRNPSKKIRNPNIEIRTNARESGI